MTVTNVNVGTILQNFSKQMRTLTLVAFVLLLACVLCGNPACQRNGDAQGRTADNFKVLAAEDDHEVLLLGPIKQLQGLKQKIQEFQTLPNVATSYTELPDTDDGTTGPHNDNRVLGREFVSTSGKRSVSCQIDCLSTVVDQGQSRVMFKGCRNQFYSYGAEKQVGCFSQLQIMELQAKLAMDVCSKYAGCQFVFVPKNPVDALRKAKGKNSVGKFFLKIFQGVIKAVKAVGKVIGKVGKAVGKLASKVGKGIKKFFKRIRF
jgi:hypothetical protein